MKISILGTVGVPGRYGGFETLADNLVQHHQKHGLGEELSVYCSAEAYGSRPQRYLSADLRYSRFRANGIQSIAYDAVTLADSAFRGCDVALLLGVSGAIILPILRLVSRMRIVTNVDGIEWRRDKWKGMARWFLRLSECMAVRFSHEVVADNEGIADYLRAAYGIEPKVIAYGGDHALEQGHSKPAGRTPLPPRYALALCRIEPENNVAMILEAFVSSGTPLVFVGNWNNSDYGRNLRQTYGDAPVIHLVDPVYDPGELFSIRAGAALYVHGHSAGGTNPSLVEMMHFGVPILAFDCVYNRYTTEHAAAYFSSAQHLATLLSEPENRGMGASLREIARQRYCWQQIGDAYFSLLRQPQSRQSKARRKDALSAAE